MSMYYNEAEILEVHLNLQQYTARRMLTNNIFWSLQYEHLGALFIS